MEIYFAPMEGITRYIYRNAYEQYFGGIDKYFAPFICANSSGNYKKREITDILPENNQGIILVPQVMTNKAKDFLLLAEKLQGLGYQEVNLNLGCPSGTVVSKKKGAGFLAYPEELDDFLEEIFSQCSIQISIKTRIGMSEYEEFYRLLEIYNKYPMSELIIHPRLRSDFYKNKPNQEAFLYALSNSKNAVCYNGDVNTVEDYLMIEREYKGIKKIMLGRGLLRNPSLLHQIRGKEVADKQRIYQFHTKIYEDYKILFGGDKNCLFKMKEIWFYMGSLFADAEKCLKKIKKAQSFSEYEMAVASLFREKELL